MSLNPRKIIAVDMDEVIADALGEHLLRYNRDFPPNSRGPLTREALHGKHMWEAVPADRLATLQSYIDSEDFFANLDVMADAQRVLHRLQSSYEIFIATAAMEVPTSFTAKYEWLGRHFPYIPTSNIVFCGDKSILRADFLIDDNPRQLARFEGRSGSSTQTTEPRREGILYTSPANAHITGYRRVHNWLEVEAMFLD
jgi:5'(3')-deoxyribonucleotidase